jgi:1-phosphofructokinase family hexose kinase
MTRMIVTVTPNTAIDRTLFVPSFALGQTIRASRIAMGMGGKPTDASYVLGALGIPNLALGFAAGLAGQQMEQMLHAFGVTTDFTPVDGETRVNTLIVDESAGQQSTITVSTLKVRAEHIAQLRERYRRALETASCVILGGALPDGAHPSLFAELIADAKNASVPVVFDASPPGLRAGLEAGPDYAKPNRSELTTLVGNPANTAQAIYDSARAIYTQYGTACIVTLGKDGALAVLPDRSYFIPPLQVEVVSSAGAGDAILAGLAAALSRGEPIEQGLRLGFAAAGAVLLTPETALCHASDVDRLLPQVELRPYP